MSVGAHQFDDAAKSAHALRHQNAGDFLAEITEQPFNIGIVRGTVDAVQRHTQFVADNRRNFPVADMRRKQNARHTVVAHGFRPFVIFELDPVGVIDGQRAQMRIFDKRAKQIVPHADDDVIDFSG